MSGGTSSKGSELELKSISIENHRLNIPPSNDKQSLSSSIDVSVSSKPISSTSSIDAQLMDEEQRPASNPADFKEKNTTLSSLLDNTVTSLYASPISQVGSPTGTASTFLQGDDVDRILFPSQSVDYNNKKITKLLNRKTIHKAEDCTLPYDLFPGAKETIRGEKQPLKMPAFKKNAASLTLPSRLELLGNQDFRIGAALAPMNIGNAVVGYDIDYIDNIGEKKLYLLPFIFSKAMAYMMILFRLLIFFVIVVMILSTTAAVQINVAWIIGVTISLCVMVSMARYRWSPEGDMIFCRSMGIPDIEEIMFSYSWKKNEDEVRTLAKAVWNAGVGVWIDVVKTPGDEIRPVVRTIVRDVRIVVVFLSNAYISSANCCVEFAEAVKHPEKLWICYLEHDAMSEGLINFIQDLKPAKVCYGTEHLIGILCEALEDTEDDGAYEWWCNQKISSNTIPSNITTNNGPKWEDIPEYKVFGDPWWPRGAISCGPVYISGNCKSNGISMRLPYHFIGAFIAIFSSIFDIWLKFYYDNDIRTLIDYIWLSAVCVCNLSPFWAGAKLFETRVFCDEAIRPLLASKSIQDGVLIDIVGDADNVIVKSLRGFLKNLGHLHALSEPGDHPELPIWSHLDQSDKYRIGLSGTNYLPEYHEYAEVALPIIQIQVINSLEHRNALFGEKFYEIDLQKTIFVWNGDKSINPFSDDDFGHRMMSVLCLVAAWENNLAQALFSALGIRVVHSLHPSRSVDGSDEFISVPTLLKKKSSNSIRRMRSLQNKSKA